MATLFTRIIEGEIPGVFVWRDTAASCSSPSTPCTPATRWWCPGPRSTTGSTSIPTSPRTSSRCRRPSARPRWRRCRARRIGVMIVGDEVPHVHLHVVPFDSVSELSFAHADPNPPEGSLEAAAEKIRPRCATSSTGRRRARQRVAGGPPRRGHATTSGWHATPRSSGTASPRWTRTPTNAPVIVERAEGHELIDVDGRRYLDAISSLWVNTLGHRVPELDDAVREQLDRGAHSTMLGNGNRRRGRAGRGAGARRARRRPALPVRVRRRRRGRAGAEDRVPVLGQPRRDGTHHVPRVRRRVPRRHHRRALGRRRRVRHRRSSTRCASPCCARPASTTPRASTTACAMVAEHAAELAAVIVEPLVQGAAGMQLADPAGLAALGDACRAHDVLLICDEVATGFGRTGTLFASRAVRPAPRPAGARARASPAGTCPMSATVASGPVFDAFLGADLVRAHAVPRPLLLRERARGRGRAAPPRAARRVGRARQRAGALRRAARLLDDRVAPHPRCARSASAGSWAASSWRRRPTGCAGAGGCAPPRSSGACCCARSATSSCSCRRSRSRRTSCTASSTRSPARSTRSRRP